MTAELTAEQIVTNLLASNEIIKPTYVKPLEPITRHNLGEYLLNKSYSTEPEDTAVEEPSKYTFIKGKWEI